MLDRLIDDFRSVKAPLSTGYVVLLVAWLWLGESGSVPEDWAEPVERLGDVVDFLGPSGRLAAITFLATMLGVTLHRAVVDGVVDRIEGWTSRHWDEYVQIAVERVTAYETYSVRTYEPGNPILSRLDQSAGPTYTVPSPFRALEMQRTVAERRSQRSGVRFRISLVLSLSVLALTLTLVGPAIWAASLILPAWMWWDIRGMTRSVRVTMVEAELEERRQALQRETERLTDAQSVVDDPDVRRGEPAEMKAAVDERDQIQAEVDILRGDVDLLEDALRKATDIPAHELSSVRSKA